MQTIIARRCLGTRNKVKELTQEGHEQDMMNLDEMALRFFALEIKTLHYRGAKYRQFSMIYLRFFLITVLNTDLFESMSACPCRRWLRPEVRSFRSGRVVAKDRQN